MIHNNEPRTLFSLLHNATLFILFFNLVFVVATVYELEPLQHALLGNWLVYVVCIASPVNANLKGAMKYLALLPLTFLVGIQFLILSKADGIEIKYIETDFVQSFMAICLLLACAFFAHLLTTRVDKNFRFFSERMAI